MTDIIVVRQLADDLWQWRYADSRTGWHDEEVYSGDLEALSADLLRPGMPAFYILHGETVVTQRIAAEARERRHLHKLVPFQLKEQAIDPVDNLHFSLGPVREGRLAVAYTARDSLQETMAELESAGCDIVHCVADFLMMQRLPDAWTLYADEQHLLVHYDEGLGLAAELPLATAVLSALVQQQKVPVRLELCAQSAESLERLKTCLPAAITNTEELDVITREVDYWDLLDPTAVPELDFRSGAFGRRLPLMRWWREWRAPAIATAAAFALAIAVTAGRYWQAKIEQERILVDMQQIYRQAVPNADDSVRDPERRLAALVSGLGGSQSSSNVVYLLGEVAPAVASKEGLSVSNFRYSQDNRELQINLEATDFSLLESLRTEISERGLTAELLRVSAEGSVHQARMRVVEGGL